MFWFVLQCQALGSRIGCMGTTWLLHKEIEHISKRLIFCLTHWHTVQNEIVKAQHRIIFCPKKAAPPNMGSYCTVEVCGIELQSFLSLHCCRLLELFPIKFIFSNGFFYLILYADGRVGGEGGGPLDPFQPTRWNQTSSTEANSSPRPWSWYRSWRTLNSL